METICLLGSSSGRNAGDAALIGAIMADLDQRFGRSLRYEIPTINPSYVKNAYPNNTIPVGMMPWHLSVKMFGLPTYRSILRSDLVLIFDAILFDRSLLNPLFNYMSTLNMILPRARRGGKKMAMYNVGAGPVSTKLGTKMLRNIAELMDFITVRDVESGDILRDVGIADEKIEDAADAALNAPFAAERKTNSILRLNGIEDGVEFIAVNINAYLDTWSEDSRGISREEFLNSYAGAIDDVWATHKTPFLFVVTQHMDVDIANELSRRVNSAKHFGVLSNRNLNHEEIKAILGRAGLVVGMRLHSIILSASMCTPVVGLEYQPKVKYFMNSVGLGPYSLPFRDFNRENLAGLIEQAWSNRGDMQHHLRHRIPEMQAMAKKPVEHVWNMSIND